MALLVAPHAVHAATAYRLTVTQSNDFTNPKTVARVIADGPNQRIEVERDPERAMAFDILLSSNGGRSYTALNTRLKTWYGPVGRLLPPDRALLARDNPKLIDAFVNKEDEGRYAGRLSYTAKQQGARVSIGITVLVSTTDAIPASAAVPLIPFTGFREIDTVWLPKLATISGFPQTIDMVFTRVFEGGRPVTNLVIATVDDVKTVDAPAALFARPANYINQEPIMAGPGVSKRTQ